MDAVVRGINKCLGSSQREWPDCLEDHRNLHGGDNIWMGSGGSDDKESACNAGDLGSIPELERSPGEGKGYPLQYSGLENSMAHGPFMRSQRVRHDRVTFTSTFQLLGL